ncbi:MAG: hypothetical protein ACPGYL_11055, partial [Rhodospirillaceae bacterium]
ERLADLPLMTMELAAGLQRMDQTRATLEPVLAPWVEQLGAAQMLGQEPALLLAPPVRPEG